MTTPRLPKLSPAELDEQQRALYDAIASGPRARGPQLFALTDADGGLEGPFNAMLLSPPVGGALAGARQCRALRQRRWTIATVRSPSWSWHTRGTARSRCTPTKPSAARPASRDDELAALRTGDYEQLTEHDRLVANTAAALAVRSELTDDEFGAARDALGLRLLFELTTLVGYYATLALQLRVFDVGAPS